MSRLPGDPGFVRTVVYPDRKGGKRRAWLVRLRVYMAKRDPYPEEMWAWKK